MNGWMEDSDECIDGWMDEGMKVWVDGMTDREGLMDG